MRLDSPSLGASQDQGSPFFANTAPPTIDVASLMLGVGWKVVGQEDDADMACAVRGWARYIENHYPLAGVEIMLKSQGQETFVVRAAEPAEGWWLFKEDLSEGRLISASWEGCLAGLRAVPTIFEGAETISAMRTPPPPVHEMSTELLPVQEAGGMEID